MTPSNQANSLPPEKLQTAAQHCSLRACTPADADRIIALQNQIFNTTRTIVDWRWNNEQNPYYGYLGVICELDGELIGSYCAIGVKLNLLGLPILACQPTNSIIADEHRGRGIFTMMTDKMSALYQDFKVQVMFGFPNHVALPINLGRLGMYNLGIIKNYTYKLRLEKHLPLPARASFSLYANLRLTLKESLSKLWAWGTTFSIVDKIPDDYDGLWNNLRKQEVVALWKDLEYLRWRYEQNLQFKSSYFEFRVNGKLVGLAVTAMHDGAGTICELLCKDKSVGLAKFMIYKICRYYMDNGVDAVKFYGHDRGFFDTAFADFVRIPNQDLFFVGKALEGEEHIQRLLHQSFNWSISAGDFFF